LDEILQRSRATRKDQHQTAARYSQPHQTKPVAFNEHLLRDDLNEVFDYSCTDSGWTLFSEYRNFQVRAQADLLHRAVVAQVNKYLAPRSILFYSPPCFRTRSSHITLILSTFSTVTTGQSPLRRDQSWTQPSSLSLCATASSTRSASAYSRNRFSSNARSRSASNVASFGPSLQSCFSSVNAISCRLFLRLSAMDGVRV
jgi:hypothetical protein